MGFFFQSAPTAATRDFMGLSTESRYISVISLRSWFIFVSTLQIVSSVSFNMSWRGNDRGSSSSFRGGDNRNGGSRGGYGGGGGGGGSYGGRGDYGEKLSQPKWEMDRLQPFEKDFYKPHPNLVMKPIHEIEAYRASKEITTPGYPGPGLAHCPQRQQHGRHRPDRFRQDARLHTTGHCSHQPPTQTAAG